jgi:hypothetical protein
VGDGDHHTVGDLARYDLMISRLSAATWLAEAGDREAALARLARSEGQSEGTPVHPHATLAGGHSPGS